MRVCEFGEDKVLRLIFEGLGVERGFFVDIGAGGPYSNTDWLKALGWDGLQVDRAADGSKSYRDIPQHVTAENVGAVMSMAPRGVSVDFLSIDVDGMDYWLLEAVFRSGARPRVVCVEFNQGKESILDVQPYDPTFVWPGGPASGCSWRALNALCESVGYILAFKNLVNCIFVVNDARTLGALFPKSEAP